MTWTDLQAAAAVFLLLALVALWLMPAGATDVDWGAELMRRWKDLKRRGLS